MFKLAANLRVVPIFFLLLPLFPAQMKPDREEMKKIKNPLARNPEAISAGEKAFQSTCSFCHGTDGKGTGRGPNLTTGRWAHGGLDAELFQSIKKGIPGTPMAPYDLPDSEIWQLIAYIRSLGVKGDQPPVRGNPENGRTLFFGKAGCSSCHMIQGAGSPVGPELGSIGAERSAEGIRKAILNPDEEIASGFITVRLQLKNGDKVEGVVKNEDEFSIQVMDKGGRFRMLDKSEVSSVTRDEKKSLMPAGIARGLSGDEFQNLLAFLDRQRRGIDATQ